MGLMDLNKSKPAVPHPHELDPVVKPRGVASGERPPNLDSPRLDRGAHHQILTTNKKPTYS